MKRDTGNRGSKLHARALWAESPQLYREGKYVIVLISQLTRTGGTQQGWETIWLYILKGEEKPGEN